MQQPTILQLRDYAFVLRKAYYDDLFWRRLVAKPADTLYENGIVLNPEDTEKLYSVLGNFSFVFAFDKYRDTELPENKVLYMTSFNGNPPDDPATGWSCDDIAPRVPWGQT